MSHQTHDRVEALLRRADDEARSKHPHFPADPLRRLRILTEEVGEVARALDPTGLRQRHRTIAELAQVAVTAIRWIEQELNDA